jgi:WD40 repeat protein
MSVDDAVDGSSTGRECHEWGCCYGPHRALSASDNTLRLWDLNTGDSLHVLQGHSSEVTRVVALDRGRALSSSRSIACPA